MRRRTWLSPRAISVRHRVKCVDRLLGNTHLKAHRFDLYTPLAQQWLSGLPQILIQEDFVRAGPGGQNVNKVSTAVQQLRVGVARSPFAARSVRARLIALAGRRVIQDGVLILSAERYGSQRRNRDDALERLLELIREVCEVDTPRRPTRPTLATKKRRLEGKQRRGETKKLRGTKPAPER